MLDTGQTHAVVVYELSWTIERVYKSVSRGGNSRTRAVSHLWLHTVWALLHHRCKWIKCWMMFFIFLLFIFSETTGNHFLKNCCQLIIFFSHGGTVNVQCVRFTWIYYQNIEEMEYHLKCFHYLRISCFYLQRACWTAIFSTVAQKTQTKHSWLHNFQQQS